MSLCAQHLLCPEHLPLGEQVREHPWGGGGRAGLALGTHCDFAACRSGLLTTFRSLPSANTFFSASSWSRMVFCSSGAFAPRTTATSSPPWNTMHCTSHGKPLPRYESLSRARERVRELCLVACPRSRSVNARPAASILLSALDPLPLLSEVPSGQQGVS